jgi:fibrillarin-like pre-rRNA processing protein
MSKIKPHKLFEIYQEARGKRLFTKSIFKGYTPFAERTARDGSNEYREFDPKRSKLAATIMKGCTNVGIRKDDVVLYLGVSHGYTASFVSDIIGEEGLIFGIDPAPRVVRDLVFLSEKRKNIVPMLADANHPEEYKDKICLADVVYQDIAQKNQSDIFIRNCNLFLKKGGYGLLAVKARSIDVKTQPTVLFKRIRKELEEIFTVVDYRIIEPYQKDHVFIIIKKT